MVHPDDSTIADLDRDTFRELGYRTVDLIADYTAELDDHPVYPAADPADIEVVFDALAETGGRIDEEWRREASLPV